MDSSRLRQLVRSPLAIALLLGVIAAPLAEPILRGAPCSDDFTFHLLRLTQLDALLAQGTWYSRWAPDMALGFGFPLFNFYAPFSYYVASLVSQFTPDLQVGLRLTLALCIWCAGLSAYLLARDNLGRPAALAAATAYMTAPYFGYDVYFRGNLAESLAWVWLPLALWAMGRFVRRGGLRWLAIAALAYAVVLLTHNVFALIFSPLLAIFGLAWWLGERLEPGARRRLFGIFLALLLGLALAAFFWLPALMERGLVYSDRLLVPPVFVYWNNFITLGEIFAAPQVIHPDLINPSPPRALGLVPALLAVPALFALRERGVRRQLVAAAGLGLLGATALMLAPSEPIWARLPLLEFIQFPWRLLGPGALCLALLVGASVDLTQQWLAGTRFARLVAGVALLPIAILPVTHLYWFTPRFCATLKDPSTADIVRFELETNTIGTTAKGEYVPRTVERYPEAPNDAPFDWPVGVTVPTQTKDAVGVSAQIEAKEPFTAVANVFAYPGWQALVDDVPVAVEAMPESGLLAFSVPAGQHTLQVRWRETPLRGAADGLSLLSLILACVLLAIAPSRRRTDSLVPATWSTDASLLTWIVAGGTTLFLLGLLPHVEGPLKRPLLDKGSLPPSLTPVGLDFADGMRLVGYWLEPEAENQWRFDLVWTVVSPPSRSYQTTMTIEDDQGIFWSDKASSLPRDHREPYDTQSWLPGQAAIDSHLLSSLPGTPPGTYEARVTIFDRESLAVLAPRSRNAGPVTLRPISVVRPQNETDLAEIAWQIPAEASWGDVRLLGFNLDRQIARPGDPVRLTLFWTTQADMTRDLTARVSLVDDAGVALLDAALPPAREGWPTSRWLAGDIWQGQHSWRLPAALPGGQHEWTLQLCPGADPCPGSVVRLGSLTIDEPPRSYEMPPVAQETEVIFGQVARLAGLTTETNGAAGDLLVRLVWQAIAETDISYRVFVHLLDREGNLVAQSDAEPAAWARPTTGWLPGEVIEDEHRLLLPDDRASYQLAIGLYDADGGGRLDVTGALETDRLVLPLP